MTQVIITTDTEEEMKKILSLVKKNKLHFKYSSIKGKSNLKPGKENRITLANEDAVLYNAIEEGRKSEVIDTEEFMSSLQARCK